MYVYLFRVLNYNIDLVFSPSHRWQIGTMACSSMSLGYQSLILIDAPLAPENAVMDILL